MSADSGVEIVPVDPVMIVPFVLLLVTIAVAPFINKRWWEKNYPAVSVSLGLVVVVYYLLGVHNLTRVVTTLHEYISFIALLGSLFVVSGGIHIRLKGKATPLANVILLGFGSLIANIVGTTGASMLLIRPYIRTNKYHIRSYHIVFFIFLVSNVGGALTPIGDPPLFLGYLKGIPFFWFAQYVWLKWLIVVSVLLMIFYVIDTRDFRKRSASLQHKVEEEGEKAAFEGLQNLGFLLAILVAVFIENPVGVREAIMTAAAAGSYYTTSKKIHDRNNFNFIPIKEVAILFLGIFATMMPALDWLTLNVHQLGIVRVEQFYWMTGALSSVLDNAPTYLSFLAASFGLFHLNLEDPQHMQIFLQAHWWYIQAVSIAAVFFGAMTYIGNGPNFMVKSIAEQSGVEMPSFFGYIIRYSLPILLPIYIVVWFFFFH
ncbi:MAG: sodium:proton antiporter [Bacteroidota bacterium]|nr:sodium:proton antiporter [Bacteroidota bacterium]